MHPPQYVLDEIERLHPHARLGWSGAEDDPKAGFFFVQLIPKRLVDYEYNEPWNNQGPVYGSDYDHLERIPYKMAGPFHPRSESWEDVIASLKTMFEPLNDRLYKQNRAKGEAYDDWVKDLAGEMGSYLYWKSKQTGATTRTDIPYKTLTEDEKSVLRGEQKRDLRDTFVPRGLIK